MNERDIISDNRKSSIDTFIVTPNDYTQAEWCRMYTKVVNEYQNLYNNYDNVFKKINKVIYFLNIYIQTIEQQPEANLGNDELILEHYKFIKKILKDEGDKSE